MRHALLGSGIRHEARHWQTPLSPKLVMLSSKSARPQLYGQSISMEPDATFFIGFPILLSTENTSQESRLSPFLTHGGGLATGEKGDIKLAYCLNAGR